MLYRFQISAQTQLGETIGLVGSIPELGSWRAEHGLRLQTSSDRYPLWWVDVALDYPSDAPPLHYKYVRWGSPQATGDPIPSTQPKIVWEALGKNRWIPLQGRPDLAPSPDAPLIIEDGSFGRIQPWPHGYYLGQQPHEYPLGEQGLNILILGSSVALGCSAWLMQGWAAQLAQTLHQRYGHRVRNASQLGATVSSTLERFTEVVAADPPQVVIIALSLGNEGLAYCPPHERRAVQRRFESGLLQLVKLTRVAGAMPILGGLYPHGDYTPDHHWLLQDTHRRIMTWGIPVLDWLSVLNNGSGRWQPGIGFDSGHPNSEGHRRMAAAIDLSLFDLPRQAEKTDPQDPDAQIEIPVFQDAGGLQLSVNPDETRIRVINPSPYAYRLNPDWTALQTALTLNPALKPGIYITKNPPQGALPFFSIRDDRTLETSLEIPPHADVEYSPVFHAFSPDCSQILFYDGQLGILKESDTQVRILNESDHDYSLHPMWKEVRGALKGIPPGVYRDPLDPQAAFRTLMVGTAGLESRVKVAAKSSMLLSYHCPLSAISRVAIVPLGDRCAVRMMLYKMEYDGPAFPFDLTRTTEVSDVADIIASGFHDMWNPALLEYNAEAGRIFHRRWSGLSFAHEVEEGEDPVNTMDPIYARMRSRYQARSARFGYTLRHADQLLFVRTGSTQRGSVIDLLHKLRACCPAKPLRLLILSAQPSQEFAGLPDVVHVDWDFNPDSMYADVGYWLYCTEVLRGILDSLGVSSQNLFWCPPDPPR